jgi:hypothetical protein
VVGNALFVIFGWIERNINCWMDYFISLYVANVTFALTRKDDIVVTHKERWVNVLMDHKFLYFCFVNVCLKAHETFGEFLYVEHGIRPFVVCCHYCDIDAHLSVILMRIEQEENEQEVTMNACFFVAFVDLNRSNARNGLIF